MRKNKKNWEIFSKSWKENAIVCDHFPTTPALIPTTNNRENNMDIMKSLHEDQNIAFAIATLLGRRDYPDTETVMAVHNLTREQSNTAIRLAKEYNNKNKVAQ